MITLVKTIKAVIGKESKRLIAPIVLSSIDSILHMVMFGIMVVTIIDLLNTSFTFEKLGWYSLALVVLFVFRAAFYSVNYTSLQYRGSDIAAYLRLSIGDHIRSLNLGYFNKNSIGELVSTLTTDISDFEQVLTHSLSSLFKTIFFSVLAFALALIVDGRFALMVLVIVAVAVPLLGISGKMAKKNGGRHREAIRDVVSRIVEYLNGIKTFKLYNLIGEKFARMDDSFVKLKRESIRLELSIMPFSISFSILTSLLIPCTLIFGVYLLQGGALDTQTLIIVIMISISISTMMATLGSLYPELGYLSKAATNILAVRQEEVLPYALERFEVRSPEVVFDKVSFGYTDDTEALHAVSFVARPNTVTALVGPSGSGKTTTMSLVCRFWDTTRGSITIDGTDIKTVSPDGLTANMAIVFQDVYLLNDTIEANIKVGKPSATHEEVVAAACAAQCHAFVSELPEGYDTLVGEGGSTLSGGEKQRISIARALIKDAPIVLLDETTSSLDADNEREINKALDVLMRGKTVFVIAHRLNTITNADNILVFDGGRIVEQGTHAELLQVNGWYTRVVAAQEAAKRWTA